MALRFGTILLRPPYRFARIVLWYFTTPIRLKVLHPPPRVLSSAETADRVVAEAASLVRFGDGEMRIISGRSIRFQKYDARLAARLTHILSNGSEAALLVGIPDVFNELSHLTPQARRNWQSHLSTNLGRWVALTNKESVYGDSLITRFYMSRRNKAAAFAAAWRLRQAWDNQDLLVVEGEGVNLGRGNDLLANARSVRRVVCSAENAFQQYDQILSKVIELHQQEVVLSALGPTATVLAYDLAHIGIRALDIGHLDVELEWFRMQAVSKVPVAGKQVSELAGRTLKGGIDGWSVAHDVVADLRQG